MRTHFLPGVREHRRSMRGEAMEIVGTLGCTVAK